MVQLQGLEHAVAACGCVGLVPIGQVLLNPDDHLDAVLECPEGFQAPAFSLDHCCESEVRLPSLVEEGAILPTRTS
eukprot:15473866-Alexandrium_andersonii.AAC.1